MRLNKHRKLIEDKLKKAGVNMKLIDFSMLIRIDRIHIKPFNEYTLNSITKFIPDFKII